MKRSKAKRNSIRPAPGWKVYPQWHTSAPDEFTKRTGVSCAGDGEVFETREDAVLATWDEYELDLDEEA